jgi:TonB family protein
MKMKPILCALALTALSWAGATPRAAAQDSAQTPQRVRVGGNVQQAKVIHMVKPAYPDDAKNQHIEGTIVLHVVIAHDGTVKEVSYVSGPDALKNAAVEAVRQWSYVPTLLNGEPVEVDTTVSVLFTLSGSDPSAPANAAAGAGAPASATGAANSAPQVDPQLRADLLHMFDIAHLRDQLREGMQAESQEQRPVLAKVFPDTPNKDKILDRFFDKLVQQVTSAEAMEQLVPIYAKYYSDDDVKAVIKFYESPIGQKYVAAAPKLAADSMQWSGHNAEKAAPEVLQQLCGEFAELRASAKFCTDEKQ